MLASACSSSRIVIQNRSLWSVERRKVKRKEPEGERDEGKDERKEDEKDALPSKPTVMHYLSQLNLSILPDGEKGVSGRRSFKLLGFDLCKL